MSAVVPGFKAFAGKQRSGSVFAEENKQGIEAAAERETHFMGDAVKRPQKGSAAIDGKHPEGSGSLYLKVVPLQRFTRGEKDLDTPAGDAAMKEQFRKRHQIFLFLQVYNSFFFAHGDSMGKVAGAYTVFRGNVALADAPSGSAAGGTDELSGEHGIY